MRNRRGVIAVAVALAAVVVVVSILPGLVRMRLERQIERLTGHETAIGDVDLNLFTRRLVVHDLRVRDRPGEPALATLARFDARFHLLAFLGRGAYVLDAAEVVRPVVRVVRTGDDRFNVSELLERLAEPDDGPPLELRVAEATVSDGWLGFEDRVVSPPLSWAAEALNAEVTSLSTEPEDPAGGVTAAFTVAGAPATVRARDVRLRPARGHALLTVRELSVGDAWRYIPGDAAIRPAGGRITVRADVVLDPDTGLHLDSDGTLTDLALLRRGQAEPWIVTSALTLVSRHVVYRDGGARAGTLEVSGDATLVETGVAPPQRVPLRDTRVTLTGVAVPGPAPGRVSAEAGLPDGGRLEARGDLDIWPFTTHLEVTVADAPLALAAPHVPGAAPVQLAGGRLDADLVLAMTPDGVALDGDVTARDVTLHRRGRPEPFVLEPRLHARIEGLVARDEGVTLDRLVARGAPTIVDTTATPPQRYAVASARFTVTHASLPSGPPARVAFDATLDTGGRVSAHGTARLGPARARLAVSATDLPLPRLNAYLAADAPVTVARGRLGGALDVRYAAPDGLRVDGDLRAEDTALRRRDQDEPLVEDARVQVSIAGFVVDGDGLALQRLRLEGAPAVTDATATPPQRFATRWMTAVVEDATWPPRAPVGVTVDAESEHGATSSVEGRVDLATLATEARVYVAGVRLERLDAYLPPDSPVRLGGGRLTATVDFAHAGTEQRITARGRVDDLALALRDQPVPFLTAPESPFTLDDLVVRDGDVSVARATVGGTPTTVALAGFGVQGGRLTFLRSTAVVENLVLPDGGAAPVRLEASLPGDGAVAARGTLDPGTPRLDLAVDVARVEVTGLDTLVRLAGATQGILHASLRVGATLSDPLALTATGALTLEDIAVADGERVPVRARRVVATGLEVRWPPAVSIAELGIEEPSLLVERAPDGSVPLRALLTPRRVAGDEGEPVAASARGEPATARATRPDPGGGTADAEVPVEIGRLAIADGDLRFIDRTVTPVYSEEVSDLSLTVTRLTTDPERTAEVAAQGVVGGSAALELRGEVAPFGEPFYLDVSGTLRDFPAPRTNPYVQHHTAWAIQRGDVRTDVHYRIVGDELEATNRLVVERLAVTRMEPEARVEIPLGLVVSLLKDARGDIRLTVPVRGRLGSPEFDFGQAIAQAFKNVLTRLVTAPLRAIGRVFRSPDDGAVAAVAVDPVPFEPGSAVLTPEAERHLHQVADVLRSSSFVRIRLTAPVTGDDLVRLVTQDVIARVQRRQRERTLTFEEAAQALFTETFPDRPVPDSLEAVVDALRESAAPPHEAARALGEQRLAVTRQALVAQAGVAPEQLGLSPEAVRVGAAGVPRVELGLDSS